MREITIEQIIQAVRQLCIEASCDLPKDVEQCIIEAAEREVSPFGQYSLQKIVKNIGIARENTVPMCQDTGMAVVFAEVGQEVHITGGLLSEAINEGVRQGYTDGYLRKSMVKDPLLERVNTNDNTPAILYTTLVAGDQLKLIVMPKGAGSENMGGIKMLKPADGLAGVKRFVVDTVRNAGGNPAAWTRRRCYPRWPYSVRQAALIQMRVMHSWKANCWKRSIVWASGRRVLADG